MSPNSAITVSFRSFIIAGLSLVCLSGSSFGAEAEQYRWSVQYLIDQSQSVFGRSQSTSPRNNRALAVSPDRKFLYAAYIWTLDRKHFFNKGEIRKIDLTVADYENATVALLPSPICKALAVDDAGRVYAAMGTQISVYDPDLAHELYVIPTSNCEGVAVARGGSGWVLYATERDRHSLKRFEVTGDARGAVTEVKEPGFEGSSGELVIPEAVSLRSVAVDTKGRIWASDVDGNQVFRVEPDGRNLKSIKLPAPLAVAFDGPRGYVSLSKDRQVAIIDDEMNVAGAVAVPFRELELAELGNNHQGVLAGIVVDPGKGFFVSNAHGQTANQRSTYGRIDKFSDVVKGKLFTDSFCDDNDPILHAVIATGAPEEPSTTRVGTGQAPAASIPPRTAAPGGLRGMK